jgi:O-antigen ligase
MNKKDPFSKVSAGNSARISAAGPMGVCLYLFTFWMALDSGPVDISLTALSLAAMLAFWGGAGNDPNWKSLLPISVLIFLFATGLSVIGSQYAARSLKLSASFLPGIMIFLLISGYFQNLKYMTLLYGTISMVGLVLSALLLWTAWKTGDTDPQAWITAIGSPVLVVPNDVALLSIATPFSLVLLYRAPLTLTGCAAGLSMLLSACVVVVFQSGVGLVTMIAALSGCLAFLRTPKFLAWGFVALIPALFVDWLLNFPLLERFIARWAGNGRVPFWLAGWSMFLDAPVLGHGPHTFGLFYKKYVESFLPLPQWLGFDGRDVPWAHNLYVEILAQEGIIGFASLTLLIVSAFAVGLRTRSGPEDVRLLGAGALGALIGFCVASLIELTFLRHWVVIMFFVLLGCLHRLTQTELNRRVV